MKLGAAPPTALGSIEAALALAGGILKLHSRARAYEYDLDDQFENMAAMREEIEDAFVMAIIMPLKGMNDEARGYHQGILIALTYVMELMDLYFGEDT